MQEQGNHEATGQAKITKAYKLPYLYVVHTVGPLIYEKLIDLERQQLASSYKECLSLAYEQGLRSIAFFVSQQENFDFQMKSQSRLRWRRLYSFR